MHAADDVLLTGGSGLLGTEILKICAGIHAPTRHQMDITDYDQCKKIIHEINPKVIIHAAALTSPPICETESKKARNTNILGTLNILNICEEKSIKLVYISTDYVFDGNRGNYSINDAINPVNKYAMTKASAELAVKTYDNSLIIRTSFCQNQFPYEKAFVDQYTSRDYVDILAKHILSASLSSKKGIIHIGTERKTVYDLAKRRKPNVGKLSIKDVNFNAPKDTSLRINQSE